jgi:uncharacterized membrane protein (UPF0127 family)
MSRRILRVENVTRGVTLIEHGRIADNFWTRLKGLLGVRGLAAGDGLLITPANQVHTHFMAMPVDVLYVDASNVVIDIDRALRPWRIGRHRRGAQSVIELPSGTAARTGSSVGDQLLTCGCKQSKVLS